MRALLFLCLFAFPVSAQVPGGHVYAGVGGFWSLPVGSGHPYVARTRQDLALSLELAVEFERTFVALEVLYAGVFTQGYQPEFGMVSARFGFLLGAGDIAPYVAGGVGLAAENAQSTLDCSQNSCAVLFGSGPILVGELGLLLFRERRVGRVLIAAQIVEPFFSLSTAGFNTRPPGIPLVLLGVRLFL